jgi:hypothetical protein
LAALAGVTLQASIIRHLPGLDNHLGLRHDILDQVDTPGIHLVEGLSARETGLCAISVSLMAIGAADLVGSVRSCRPVPNSRIMDVAAQADTVGRVRWSRAETDDLGYVPVALHMQAAGSVAILAFDPLLGVEGMPKALGYVGVTFRARISTNPRGARDLSVFRKGAAPRR